MEKEQLKNSIIRKGEKLPKKHGSWYRLNVFDNHWLVLDTWNGQIYHYPNGATPSDTKNMYRCVYVFYDENGSPSNLKAVKNDMFRFWLGHIGTA